MRLLQVLAVATNAVGTRSRGSGWSDHTIHAERNVVKKLGDVRQLDGADMYVLRMPNPTAGSRHTFLYSKPCYDCTLFLHKCIREYGLRRVFYSEDMTAAVHTPQGYNKMEDKATAAALQRLPRAERKRLEWVMRKAANGELKEAGGFEEVNSTPTNASCTCGCACHEPVKAPECVCSESHAGTRSVGCSSTASSVSVDVAASTTDDSSSLSGCSAQYDADFSSDGDRTSVAAAVLEAALFLVEEEMFPITPASGPSVATDTSSSLGSPSCARCLACGCWPVSADGAPRMPRPTTVLRPSDADGDEDWVSSSKVFACDIDADRWCEEHCPGEDTPGASSNASVMSSEEASGLSLEQADDVDSDEEPVARDGTGVEGEQEASRTVSWYRRKAIQAKRAKANGSFSAIAAATAATLAAAKTAPALLPIPAAVVHAVPPIPTRKAWKDNSRPTKAGKAPPKATISPTPDPPAPANPAASGKTVFRVSSTHYDPGAMVHLYVQHQQRHSLYRGQSCTCGGCNATLAMLAALTPAKQAVLVGGVFGAHVGDAFAAGHYGSGESSDRAGDAGVTATLCFLPSATQLRAAFVPASRSFAASNASDRRPNAVRNRR
jgi:hypothetical protein